MLNLFFSLQTISFATGHPASSASFLVPSSTFQQTFASTADILSSSGISSKLSTGNYVDAQTLLTTSGQSHNKTGSQKSQNQLSSGRTGCQPFSERLELFAQNAASLIRAPPSSPITSAEPRLSSFLQAASQEQQQVFQPAVNVSASHQQPQTLPASPRKGCASALVGFSTTDKSYGSPVNSSCLSPDNFLSPSPAGYGADSPASGCYTGSPDTAAEDQMVLDADSGFSDNVTDKSTSPDKQEQSKDENQASQSKRRRVRKSRAKAHDPVERTIVKRTRRVRANDRERSRMHGLNDAMDELRKHIPNDGSAGKMTKIDTLRTAANYIRVLKLMLGEIDKGEDMVNWPEDMISALNNLYVQPASSPETAGMISPAPNAACEDGRLQNCVSAGPAAGAALAAGQFPGYQNQNCSLLPDNYGTVHGSASGSVLPSANPQMSGSFLGPNSDVTVVGEGGYCSVPVNNAVSAGYNLNDFASSTMNSLYAQQYSGNGHRSSAQNMLFQQSSQCY